MEKKKFVSTMRKGFHMTFENGLSVSVQWGNGNYCDNHFPDDLDFSCSKDAQSDTAEVAVIYNGNLIDANQFIPDDMEPSCDTVVGWLTPEQVVEFMCNAKNANPAEIDTY